MRHRIIVLGAGYAGAYAAGQLARRLYPDDVEITVVTAEPDFVERPRLHQLAAGQELRRHPWGELFAGTGIRVRQARVTAVDVEHRSVTIDPGAQRLEYDTLLYALGSTVAEHGVPGVGEHAFHVTARPAALRLRWRLDELGAAGTVLVVGGNLTAIETATEIAESRPGFQVSVATAGSVGGWLHPKARRHLRRAFDRLGITIHEHAVVEQVGATGVVVADGTTLGSDATVWAAGFAVHPIAAASGLDVDADGRITVDPMMRSVSHPEVYAAGDSAAAFGADGQPLPMSAASAGDTARRAVAAIVGELTGRALSSPALVYRGNCVSLGRQDAVLHLVSGERAMSWRGRPVTRYKSGVLNGLVWRIAHPTYGRPTRRHRLSSQRSAEAATA